MNRRFCNGMVHVIKEGENLYQLSRAYRVPLALILRANPYVDVYNLQVGQEICIPAARPFGGIMMPPMGRPRRPQEPAAPTRNTGMPAREQSDVKPDDKREEERMRTTEDEDMSETCTEQTGQDVMERTREQGGMENCVADGTKSLAAILRENNMSMEQFFAMNDPEHVIIAADVVYQLPKNV